MLPSPALKFATSMQQITDILTLAHKHPLMHNELELVQKQEKQIPGSVQYAIYRYKLQSQMNLEDVGELAYNFNTKNVKERSIELRFCISGNTYCKDDKCSSGFCNKQSNICADEVKTFDVLVFQYPSSYLNQFVKGKTIQTKSDELLAFKQKTSFTTSVNLCNKTRSILENIIHHNYSSALENIYVNSQLQALLLYGMECLVEEKAEESFACKFLANEADREKITLAKEILLQRIGDPPHHHQRTEPKSGHQ